MDLKWLLFASDRAKGEALERQEIENSVAHMLPMASFLGLNRAQCRGRACPNGVYNHCMGNICGHCWLSSVYACECSSQVSCGELYIFPMLS